MGAAADVPDWEFPDAPPWVLPCPPSCTHARLGFQGPSTTLDASEVWEGASSWLPLLRCYILLDTGKRRQQQLRHLSFPLSCSHSAASAVGQDASQQVRNLTWPPCSPRQASGKEDKRREPSLLDPAGPGLTSFASRPRASDSQVQVTVSGAMGVSLPPSIWAASISKGAAGAGSGLPAR